jgi:hypothetical protein
MPERRRATRIRTDLVACLVTPEGASLRVEVDDLSIVGLHGRANDPVPTGLSCRVELTLGASVADARGTVVRSRERELAVRFEHLPFESYERLRAFLLANASDPAVLADEFADRMSYLGENA